MGYSDKRGGLSPSLLNRGDFVKEIKRRFGKNRDILYLPYLINVTSFQNQCIKCKSPCVEACKQEIIFRGKDGYPILDFSLNGCTFCKECAIACEEMYRDVSDDIGTAVLDSSLEDRICATAKIDQMDCLAWKKSLCSFCKDACKYNAISFVGGMFYPEVDAKSCTSCGFCFGVCPSRCISFASVI